MRWVWWRKKDHEDKQETNDGYSTSEVYPTRKLRTSARQFHPLAALLVILTLLTAAHFIAVAYQAPPTTQPITSCATYLRHLDYTQIVPLHAGQNMDAVQFIDDVVGGQPATLIQINTNSGAQQKLDAYVYGCTMTDNTPALHLLLKQQGLVQGLVSVTAAHTLSIGQIDTTQAAANSDTLLLPQQQNVYREYAWQNGAFQQVMFPGLYPVTSRSEAEALQDEADHGPMIPWDDPLGTAEQMAQDLLHWKNSEIHGTIRDNNAIDAHIQLTRTNMHVQVLVSLSRLIRHDSHGLWFVTNVDTPGITLDQSQLAKVLTSPITVQGTTTAAKYPIKVTLFDHTINPLHILGDNTIPVDDSGTFTGHIAYTGIFPDQTALLLLETEPDQSSKDTAVIYLTNLFLR